MKDENVWQIASGDRGRDYSWLFLKHDLMFLGPGGYGPFDEKVYGNAVTRDQLTGQKVGMIRSFAKEVVPGDLVLLRQAHRVVAIGVVADDERGGYQHDDTFSDVYGWDLQHTRRVIWQKQLSGDLDAIQRTEDLFGSFKQQPTFTRVRDQNTLDSIAPLRSKYAARPLETRPNPLPPELSLPELGQKLFSRGLANDAVDKVLMAVERQRRLVSWYQVHGSASGRPDEHEVVAHMVLPLLLALGWSEQLLAVEWHKVDLAAFWGTPTTAERCVLICEAKHMGHGLQTTVDQALTYIRELDLSNCGKVLLTQGARFYLYQKPSGNWPEMPEPAGYVNVEHIREDHIAPVNTNAVDTLIALTPVGVQRNFGRGGMKVRAARDSAIGMCSPMTPTGRPRPAATSIQPARCSPGAPPGRRWTRRAVAAGR